MLVLSRRLNESIVLPNCDAKITVLSVHGDRVCLGVTAPRHVEVFRQEIWVRIQKELVAGVGSAGVGSAGVGSVPILPK